MDDKRKREKIIEREDQLPKGNARNMECDTSSQGNDFSLGGDVDSCGK